MRVVQLCVVSILISLFLSAPLRSQTRTASLAGIIKDPTGAVIPGASVTLSRPGEAQRTTTSDGQGRYELRAVLPGVYRLVAAADGFSVADIATVRLESGRTLTMEIELDVALV
jgi:hypothetical protein